MDDATHQPTHTKMQMSDTHVALLLLFMNQAVKQLQCRPSGTASEKSLVPTTDITTQAAAFFCCMMVLFFCTVLYERPAHRRPGPPTPSLTLHPTPDAPPPRSDALKAPAQCTDIYTNAVARTVSKHGLWKLHTRRLR